MADHRRQHWMSILARADALALETYGNTLIPEHTVLRGPEAGLIMLRGRAGGSGATFNLGEASVVRCTVRNVAGNVGHAYCLGRDFRHAELAAAIDAGLQDDRLHAQIYGAVITPLEIQQQETRMRLARQAAATKVQFFTMAVMRT